jgi:hypothetical protein
MNRIRTLGFVLLIVALVTMSVFPKAPGQGSFQSTSGPTTIFTAWRAALLLTMILAAAGRIVTGRQRAAVQHVQPADPSALSCTMLC